MAKEQNESNGEKQVRGSELREKAIQSERDGAEVRKQNQGADVLDQKVRHNDDTKS